MTTQYAKTHICLAGDGRLAIQLKILLESHSLPYSHVTRSRNSSEEIKYAVAKSSHVWLAISDNAIEDFFTNYSSPAETVKKWVHFSGAHNSKTIFSAHPLMTFSKSLLSSSQWKQVHFVISPPLSMRSSETLTLADLMPTLENSWSLLPSPQKAFYHALCVVAGNFPIILWSEVAKQFHEMKLPREALSIYLDHVLDNFKKEGSSALTGPLVRNDLKTIEANIQSLENNSLKPIYEAFVKSKGIKL